MVLRYPEFVVIYAPLLGKHTVMARAISESDFNRYREQAVQRWLTLEAFRIGQNSFYETSRKYSRWSTIATVVLAVATAILSALQNIDTLQETLIVWTTIVGAATGVIGVVKQQVDWDKKAEKHRQGLTGARTGLSQIRLWVESLAEGKIEEEEEALLAAIDGQYNTLLNNSDHQDYSAWKGEANENLTHQRLTEIVFSPMRETAVTQAPQTEAASEGIQRVVRGSQR